MDRSSHGPAGPPTGGWRRYRAPLLAGALVGSIVAAPLVVWILGRGPAGGRVVAGDAPAATATDHAHAPSTTGSAPPASAPGDGPATSTPDSAADEEDLAALVAGLDAGVHVDQFTDRLGTPARKASLVTGDQPPAWQWEHPDAVVRAVLDDASTVVAYTVLTRSAAFTPPIPGLAGPAPLLLGQAAFADVLIDPAGRLAVLPPNGRWSYVETFLAGPPTGHRALALAASSHGEPVQPSPAAAFDALAAVAVCDPSCSPDDPDLRILRRDLAVTSYTVSSAPLPDDPFEWALIDLG